MKTSNNSKVWLITGAARGFGQEISKAVLASGETVVATVRSRPDELKSQLGNLRLRLRAPHGRLWRRAPVSLLEHRKPSLKMRAEITSTVNPKPGKNEKFLFCFSGSSYCTSTALPRKSLIINGAGEGNRTLVSALGRPHSTIEPHPRLTCQFI